MVGCGVCSVGWGGVGVCGVCSVWGGVGCGVGWGGVCSDMNIQCRQFLRLKL